MSAFKFYCPHCEQRLEVSDDLLGQKIHCPACEGPIQLDEAKDQQNAPSSPPPKEVAVAPPAADAKPKTAPAESRQPTRKREALGGRQVLGLVGGFLLLLGVFLPIATTPDGHSLSYIGSSGGSGIALLCLAGLSLFALLLRNDILLWFTSLASLALLTLRFLELQLGLKRMLTALSSTDGPFAGLMELSAQPVHLQWGWAVLLAGAALTLLPLFIRARARARARRGFFPLSPGWRLSGGLLGLLCALALATAYTWPGGESPQQSRSWGERLFGTPASTDPAAPAQDNPLFGSANPPDESPDWRLGTDDADGRRSATIVLSRDALAPLGVGFLKTPPTLTIRYRAETLEVFVAFDTFIGSGTKNVTTGFNRASGTEQSWETSQDGTALVFPGNPDAFLRTLMAHNRLFLRFTPFGESPATFRFDLTGLAAKIGEMRDLMSRHQ